MLLKISFPLFLFIYFQSFSILLLFLKLVCAVDYVLGISNVQTKFNLFNNWQKFLYFFFLKQKKLSHWSHPIISHILSFKFLLFPFIQSILADNASGKQVAFGLIVLNLVWCVLEMNWTKVKKTTKNQKGKEANHKDKYYAKWWLCWWWHWQ